MNVAIELPRLERPGVLFGGLAPLFLAGSLEGQPHHPRVKPRTPIGPYELGAMPDAVPGVNGSGLIRGPLCEHSVQLPNAEFKSLFDTCSQATLVDVFWNSHMMSDKLSSVSAFWAGPSPSVSDKVKIVGPRPLSEATDVHAAAYFDHRARRVFEPA